MRTVEIWHDQDAPNPMDNDGSWKLYSFSTRHVNFKHPDEFRGIGFTRKLQVGTAFLLSYYEHGNCVWSLRNEGPQCQWDSVRTAGILVWEESPSNMGAKTLEERAKDARAFLKDYTAYCNGECYGYTITDEQGEIINSCGGYFDLDWIKEEIALYTAGQETKQVGDIQLV